MSTSEIFRQADKGQSPFYEDPANKRPLCGQKDLSLASLLPKMRKLLDGLNSAGADDAAFTISCPPLSSGSSAANSLLDILSDNLIILQESFADRLYETLRQWDIDAAIKLTLRLDDEAILRIEGEHPESERVTAMLAAFPEYSSRFAEIAVQSAVLRELKNLWAISNYDRVQDSYTALVDATVNTNYRISLKGEMNHFYFARSMFI